ncbi:MAG TPA: DASS family sodium-coupled anion symporter [Phycisphaerae bacterium]|nr:DASS family sodium-coupled anion symporter [Phycisphaerae bacterium]
MTEFAAETTMARDAGISTRHRIKLGILAVALLIAAVLLLGPTWVRPAQLDPESPRAAQHALAIFVVCLALWSTNLIAQSFTGLLAVALLPTFGVTTAWQSFAYFGNTAVFFILGVFVLATATIHTGLSKRMTLILLQRFDRHPRLLVAGVVCSSAFLAMWMPEHAVAAMMFPIVLEIADSLGLKKLESGYAKALFLGLAWGAIIGGVATFLGGARAPLALGLLQDAFRGPDGQPIYQVSFLGWMRASMPIVIILTAVAVFTLLRFVRWEINDITPATRMLNQRVAALGPMSSAERRLAVVGLGTIACWIFLGHRVDLSVIAVLGAVAVSAFRIADWRDIQGYVNWGVIVMYGGAIALGSAMKDTHAMHWVAEQVLPGGGASPVMLLVAMSALTIALSSAISNAAAVAVLLPIGFALGGQTDPAINPVTMTYVVALSSGLAFALPISSPPNAICYASGYYSLGQVPKYGVPMTVISWVVVVLVILVYWPLVGVDYTVPAAASAVGM